MDMAPVAKVGEYACEDADVTWQLEKVFISRLGEEEKKLMEEISYNFV